MFARVIREREDPRREKVEDDIRNGRPPRPHKLNRRFTAAILTQHPDAVLEFIQNAPARSDQFAHARA